MIKDGESGIESLYALVGRTQFWRDVHYKRMMVVCNSNGAFSASNKTKDAYFKRVVHHATIDGMDSAIGAAEKIIH